MNAPPELGKNGHLNNGSQLPQNFSPNTMHARAPLNQTTQNMLPHIVNMISPQMSVSQPGNQPMINMGFNATPFLQNQLYSLPTTFGALNTMASQGYGGGNVSYMNNGPNVQTVVNYKDPKMGVMMADPRKTKVESGMSNKTSNYPVRLLVNSELVGPLIGRKGEKIKEITATTGAKIDIKRESVPYSQFGLNNYMFSGSNRKGSGSGDGEHVVTANNHSSRGESQIVFVVGEPEKCTAAIEEIMHLCTQEAAEQGREEPNLGLLAEDRFCARIIGKEGRYLNLVRCKSGSQVHVSNVPTITTLSQQPHIISLDRIISCRGGGLTCLLEAQRLISDKVRQCVNEDGQNVTGAHKTSKDDSYLPARADMTLVSQYCNPATTQIPYGPQPVFTSYGQQHSTPAPHGSQPIIGSGIVHKANPHWPDNLKLDENLYVRIAQMCAGSIIGSEGKSVKRIMAETGTYVQISKTNLSPVESVAAVHTYRKMSIPKCAVLRDDLGQRLVTIKGSVVSQCAALAHIFHRVKMCYQQCNEAIILGHDMTELRLWAVLRIPKIMLGRLIGKDGKVIRQLQMTSHTFLSFPRLHTQLPLDAESQCLALTDHQPSSTRADNPMSDLLHNPDSAIFGDPDLHPVEIFGSFEAVECAILMIRRLIYSSIFTQYGPALIPGPVPSSVPFNPGQFPPNLLLQSMMPWHRHNGDFTNQCYNTIPNMTRTFGASINNHPYKNFKRTQFNQRSRGDIRPQSEMKNVCEESNGENEMGSKPCREVATEKDEECVCNREECGGGSDNQEGVVPTSPPPPRVVSMQARQEESASPMPPSDTSSVPTVAGDADAGVTAQFAMPDRSPMSTATYYTDCSPGCHSYFDRSASLVDDLSFVTAHDSSPPSINADPHAPLPHSPLSSPNNSFSPWSPSSS